MEANLTTTQHTKSYARIPNVYQLPGFIDIQLDSFRRLKEYGIAELLDEISPIESFNHGMKLYFPSNSEESREWNLKFWFATRLPDQADLDLALKMTLDHVGFYQLYGQPLIGTRVHHLRKDRDFYTVRDIETAKERVLAVTRNVFKSIRQDIWYPHEGPMCQKCQVRDFCLMYGSNLV